MMKMPELLSPAGSLEKLKIAVLYGADAVYVGGEKFGLRVAADNFTPEELSQGVRFAHAHKSKVYVALNSFFHDSDIDELPAYLHILEEMKVDALIVSDLGAITTIRKHVSIPIHLSTQASCLNSGSASIWKEMGVSRLILGRESSIKEALVIKEKVGLEIELFIHGSLCMSYSGQCVISNFTQGRDSNRGGCAHSCRFEYSVQLSEKEEQIKAYYMSSKDLMGLRLLEDFIKCGITSLKIEGRMKSSLYAGTVTKVYREAIDFYKIHGHFITEKIFEWENELKKISHRSYSTASLENPAGADSVFNERDNTSGEYINVGKILSVSSKEGLIIEVKSKFYKGAHLEALPFLGEPIILNAQKIVKMNGDEVEHTSPNMLIKLPYLANIKTHYLLRAKV